MKTGLPWKEMASGKKSKQKRRAAAPPPVRSKSLRRRRQASPRVLALAGAIVIAVIIAAVVGFGSTGGKNSATGQLPSNGSLVNALPGASDVNALLKGVPQRGLTLGSPTAPVTLVEYIDLQCPYCREFETTVMPRIVKQYVRTGKVRVVARVLAFIGPDSSRGRAAMIAAGSQGKAFNLAQVLYANQGIENTGWLDDQMVAGAARSVPGLNPRELFAMRHGNAVAQQAGTIDRQANAAGVIATPTLFVGKTGGSLKQVRLASPTDAATLVRAIQAG
jgi:protein-disulfide isomerase